MSSYKSIPVSRIWDVPHPLYIILRPEFCKKVSKLTLDGGETGTQNRTLLPVTNNDSRLRHATAARREIQVQKSNGIKNE